MKLTFKEFLQEQDNMTTSQDELQLLNVKNQKMIIDKQATDKKRPLDQQEQRLQRKLSVDKKKELAKQAEQERLAKKAQQAGGTTGTVATQ